MLEVRQPRRPYRHAGARDLMLGFISVTYVSTFLLSSCAIVEQYLGLLKAFLGIELIHFHYQRILNQILGMAEEISCYR